MKHPVVPRFEPEVVQAIADKQHRGDPEKVATTTLTSLEMHGVLLTSRYNKAGEYQVMTRMVEGLAPDLRKYINNIYCDSKVSNCFSVYLEPCTSKQAQAIADQLDTSCTKHGSGHNGISICGAQGGHIEIDPDWAWGDED